MQEDMVHLIKLNNKIFRTTQVYLDKALKKFELSSGSYPYLLILNKNEGISQNKISKELGHDKAMSARTITKLIQIGYLVKKKDEADSRANQLYLTEKAMLVIPKVSEEIHGLAELITRDLNAQEKAITLDSLNKVLSNIKNLSHER